MRKSIIPHILGFIQDFVDLSHIIGKSSFVNFFSQVSYVSNRANIYLSMKKWEEAERDASKAIEMDPKNAKVISCE